MSAAGERARARIESALLLLGHAPRLMSGRTRWLCQRSRHCLPVRPESLREIADQLCVPCSSTSLGARGRSTSGEGMAGKERARTGTEREAVGVEDQGARRGKGELAV